MSEPYKVNFSKIGEIAYSATEKARKAILGPFHKKSYGDTIEGLNKELDKSHKKIKDLRAKIEKLRIAISNLQDKRNLEYYQNKIDSTERQIFREEKKIADIQSRLENLLQRLKMEQTR